MSTLSWNRLHREWSVSCCTYLISIPQQVWIISAILPFLDTYLHSTRTGLIVRRLLFALSLHRFYQFCLMSISYIIKRFHLFSDYFFLGNSFIPVWFGIQPSHISLAMDNEFSLQSDFTSTRLSIFFSYWWYNW